MQVAVNSHSLNVLGRAAEVFAHHFDDSKQGKPITVLATGAAFALISLGFIFWHGWQMYVATAGDPQTHINAILFFLFPYFGGWFLFAYGYELYNWKKALVMALVGGVVGLAAVIILICLAALIAALFKDEKGAASVAADGFSGNSGRSGNFTSVVTSSSPGSFTTTTYSRGSVNANLLADVANLGLNVAANRINFPNASGVTFSINSGNVCSQCAQPLDPARVVDASVVAADPMNYCPKCRQPYIKAGYSAGKIG